MLLISVYLVLSFNACTFTWLCSWHNFWFVLGSGSGSRSYRWSKCLAHVPICSLSFLDKQLLGHGGVEKNEGWGALLSYRGGLEHDGAAQQMRPPASRRQAKGAKRRLPVEGGWLSVMYDILSQLLYLWETCLVVFSVSPATWRMSEVSYLAVFLSYLAQNIPKLPPYSYFLWPCWLLTSDAAYMFTCYFVISFYMPGNMIK